MSERELDPIPYPEPPIEGVDGLLSKAWFRWLEDLVGTLATAARVIGDYATGTTPEGAAIAATALGASIGGIYDVGWHLRITRAATTSSSVTVTAHYVQDGITLAQSGGAVTGNATTTVQGGILRVSSDVNSPITFSTAYVSVGGTSMQYKVEVQCVRVL